MGYINVAVDNGITSRFEPKDGAVCIGSSRAINTTNFPIPTYASTTEYAAGVNSERTLRMFYPGVYVYDRFTDTLTVNMIYGGNNNSSYGMLYDTTDDMNRVSINSSVHVPTPNGIPDS